MRNNLMILQKPDWYFGDESDGILDTVGNVSFSSTTDGPTIYRHYSFMRINAGHTVTTTNRCKGLVIYCTGDCIIDGTISMSARGANAPGENFAPNNIDKLITDNLSKLDMKFGSVGGAAVSNNTAGNAGINGVCGGGGGGRVEAHLGGGGGFGSAGTTWSGGAGGGSTTRATAGSGGVNGGAGGAGTVWDGYCAGGGAGNPGGAGNQGYRCSYATSGQSGTGGLLILIAKNIVISSTGQIRSIGSNGGGGYTSGGGSGGGAILILYSKSYLNLGSINVNGGAGGSVNQSGFAGGAGSIRIKKIFDNTLGVNI